MAKQKKTIPTNHHVFIAGMTGSGKTYFAKKYLANYPYVVVLDTKGEFRWDDVPEEELEIVEHFKDLVKCTKPKIIYRPVFEELKWEFYESFFQWVYFRKNCICLVDEVMSICPNPHKIPEYYKGVLTRGRERNTAVWSLTQRPSGIPQVILSEAQHYISFRLNLIQDREKIMRSTGYEEFLTLPPKYNFWYLDISTDEINPPVLGKLTETKAKRN